MARALFWRFSIIASSLPSASLTAGHYPQRSTLHAPRHPRRHPPGPAGAGRAQTLPRWLLPGTNRRIAKDRTGPDLDERPLYFSMSPNQAIPADKSIRFSSLAAAQPLIILSWPEAVNASGSWRACRIAISRNARLLYPYPYVRPDYRCLPPGGPFSRWYTSFLQRAPASYPTLFRHAQGDNGRVPARRPQPNGNGYRGVLATPTGPRDRLAGRVTDLGATLSVAPLRPKENFLKHGPSSINHEASRDSRAPSRGG